MNDNVCDFEQRLSDRLDKNKVYQSICEIVKKNTAVFNQLYDSPIAPILSSKKDVEDLKTLIAIVKRQNRKRNKKQPLTLNITTP